MAKKMLLGMLAALPMLLAAAAYPFLPETIATHFSGGGADSWGPKWTLLVMSAVLALLNVGIIALARYSRRDRSMQKYLVVDNAMSDGMCAGLIAVLDVALAGYVATVLVPYDAADFIASGRLSSRVVLGAAILFMVSLAAYFLSGKGAKRTRANIRHEGEPTKDDVQLSRTIGGFLLVVALLLCALAFS